jgi:DDE superfamily endonuclease
MFPSARPRLEFHYTPKHASWLNMVEIEIGVLRSQCLDRRIATKARLIAEVAAWERHRNASGAPYSMDVHNLQGPSQNGPGLSPPQRLITTVQRY